MPTCAGKIVVEDQVGGYRVLLAASGGPSSVVSTPTLGRTSVTAKNGFSIGCAG